MAGTGARVAGIAIAVIIVAIAAYLAATSGGHPSTGTPSPAPAATVTQTATQPAQPTTTATVTHTTSTMQATGTAKGLPKEIPIGLAIAVSGGYAVDGPRRLKAALLAIEEMNKLLEQAGSPYRFKPIHEDTKADPQEAVNVIKRFASEGIQIVVGPLSTSETRAVMPIANQLHIVVISPSSTGKAAAFPDDYVFRAAPPDVVQGPVLAKLIHSLGYTKLVIIARNDDYGRGLAELVKQTFEKLGGTVEEILYQPDKPDLTNEVNQLAVKVEQFGADEHTAVLIIAFDNDGTKILEQAAKTPILSRVQWFGSDSMARKTFLEKPEIAKFLEGVHFIATAPAIPKNPVAKHFEELYKQKYGEAPTTYAYYTYDATWIAMLSVLTAGTYDGRAIKAVLPTVAFHFMGATGHKMLDKNGDAALADYSILAVKDGKFVEIGVWHGSTDSAEWYQKPTA